MFHLHPRSKATLFHIHPDFQFLRSGGAAVQIHIVILADFLQIGKIRDDGNLLTGKGQVDELYDPMAAAADCRPLKFCRLPIIELSSRLAR